VKELKELIAIPNEKTKGIEALDEEILNKTIREAY